LNVRVLRELERAVANYVIARFGSRPSNITAREAGELRGQGEGGSSD
jgi:hypothetical protein